MLAYEREAESCGFAAIAGIDEAGRGPLAGPVVSAAVILPRGYSLRRLDDSKKLAPQLRESLYKELVRDAAAWGVGMCGAQEIDELNILNATIKSMELAVGALGVKPDFLLIDAVSLKNIGIAQKAIIRGDSLSLSIAAASVVAKVTRDRLMLIYDRLYPKYGFSRHKGYGTKEHMEKIAEHGLSPIHRKTFCKFVNN